MLLDIFDPKAPPRAVGIDLGTTHSIVSYVRDDKPLAIVSCDGTALLPSVVHYGKHGEVIVGRTAKALASSDPHRTIASVKRFMGRGSDDPQTRELGAYRFASVGGAHGKQLIGFDVGGRVVTPVEVSAEILRSLRTSALGELRQLGGAVITVPAYFDDAQRQATRDAGKLAGFKVLRLLNEPTAAALAYGLEKRQNGTFAIYDLGGGTFDITILRLEDGVFQVQSTGGDSALGGDDMDRAIAGKMLAALGFESSGAEAERSSSATRGALNPELVSFVLETAREAKHRLTEEREVAVELPHGAQGSSAFRLSRAEFEAAIQPLLERTGKSSRRALRDAELGPSDIDAVILVGGATRTPAVRRYVAELFGRQPLADIDPDLVVAHGAALQAHLLETQSDEVLLLDVLPLSLGVETMGGNVDKILPRNITIPVAAQSVFTTYADNQTGFEIHVVQGERELAKDCRSLARFTLRGIPPMPAGHARLEVSFNVDENGLLTVSALEQTTQAKQEVIVKPSYGLSDEMVEAMLLDALDHGEEDLQAKRANEAQVEAERLLRATEKSLQADADLLGVQERELIERCTSELRKALANRSQAPLVEAKMSALEQATHDFAGRRMNRAIQQAIGGRALESVAKTVAHAAGVDAHLQAHQRGREPPTTESGLDERGVDSPRPN